MVGEPVIDGPEAVVVGGGPAGLMAAEVLAASGRSVEVRDQRRMVGLKFLLAGRSGLNLTHSEDLETLLDRFGPDRANIEPVIRSFCPADVRAWCEGLGQPTVVGSSGRVFPAAMRATGLLRAWKERLDALGVRIVTRSRFAGFAGDGLQFENATGEMSTVRPAVTVLAAGGASWPRTGSDGEWVSAVAGAGVDVGGLVASNCGVSVGWSSVMAERFVGQPIKNVSISVAGVTARGDLMITETGLEGGPVYAQSRGLRAGHELTIDLLPDLSVAAVEQRLSRRRSGATDTSWLRRAGLSDPALALFRDALSNQIPHRPEAAAAVIKSLVVKLDGVGSIDRAISSAGGVRFAELDAQLMLRSLPGTFVAGEMLDFDAPTGGYLLQASLSSGFVAGKGAAAFVS